MFERKKCSKCSNKIKDSFDFCPYCGLNLKDPEKELEDFGLIGKNDKIEGHPLIGGLGSMGISEKMLNSIFSTLMKSLEKQMDNPEGSEVQSLPNGIQVKFGVPKKKVKKQQKTITEEQLKRMSGLPRSEAKTNVRRFSDKVVYELKAPGIESIDDVFVSKLESGYEVKAIGKKKVYTNSLPINLPLKQYSVSENGLNLEFGLH